METGQLATTWVPGMTGAQSRFTLDAESWGLDEPGFELLLGHIAGRAPPVTVDGVRIRRGRIVVLSGDVHYGFSARVEFWGSYLAGVGPERAEMVLAALTSSSLKHLNPGRTSSISLHRAGYDTLRNLAQLIFSTDAHIPLPWNPSRPTGVFVCGWNNPSRQWIFYTAPALTGLVSTAARPTDPATSDDINDAYAARTSGEADRSPDWRYRVDFIVADPEPREGLPRHGLPAGPASSRDVALRRYLDHTTNQADYARAGAGQQIVGFNNFGLVTFMRFAAPVGGVVDDVRHELWWQMERRGGGHLPFFPLTRYTVSLRLEDSNFPRRAVLVREAPALMPEDATAALLREAYRLLGPLLDAAVSADRRRVVLGQTGWRLDEIAGLPVEDLLARLSELGNAADVLLRIAARPINGLEDVRDALESSARAFRALGRLADVFTSVADAPPDLARIAEDLTAVLVRRWLTEVHPLAYEVAVLLTLVEPEEERPQVLDPAGRMLRTPARIPRLRLDRIGELLSDPAQALWRYYGRSGRLTTPEDSARAADLLFPRVLGLWSALGMAGQYGVSRDPGLDWGEAGDVYVRHMLTLLMSSSMDGTTTFGTTLALSSAAEGDLGLVVAPFGSLSLRERGPVGP